MTQEEINKIVEQHKHWLNKDCKGWENMKANLSGDNLREANLCGADLSGTDLSGANLSEANLYGANLSGADLKSANLYRADLSGADLKSANLLVADLRVANLSGADLSGANLSGAYLSEANLYGANLYCANLYGADLYGANLYGAYLSEADKFRLGQILTESLTGYKKTREGVVITVEIPAGAIVFCINGGKCRTNRAKIIDMGGHEVLHSQYDYSLEYRLGQEINIKDFNLMYNVECTSGFHFFRTRKEAEEY